MLRRVVVRQKRAAHTELRTQHLQALPFYSDLEEEEAAENNETQLPSLLSENKFGKEQVRVDTP